MGQHACQDELGSGDSYRGAKFQRRLPRAKAEGCGELSECSLCQPRRSSAVLAEECGAATEVPWYRCTMGWERHDGSGTSWDPTFEELTCDLGVCVRARACVCACVCLTLCRSSPLDTNLTSPRGEQVRSRVSSLTMATRSHSRSTTPCSSCCSSWQQLSSRLKDPEPSEGRSRDGLRGSWPG